MCIEAGAPPQGGLTHSITSLTLTLDHVSCVWVTNTQTGAAGLRHVAQSRHPALLRRFLLQLVGILLEDIVTKQLRVDMSEQQHTFYCQELGTLLMCLIHIFKSGGCLARLRECVPSRPHLAQAVLPAPACENMPRPTTWGTAHRGSQVGRERHAELSVQGRLG